MYEYTWLTNNDHNTVTEIVDLVAAVSAHDPFVGLPAQPTAAETEQLLTKIQDGLAGGRTDVLAVRAPAGQLIACVVLTRPPTANQSHIGELTTGAVHPDYRGRKVVTGAFAEIVHHCQLVGIELLRLDVRAGIRAERLWRTYGFREYGRLADYGRIDGRSYSGVYLAQSVDQLRHTIVDREVAHAQQG
jgi:ribosomal protein S18 acetylase RimI-like enzyme